jgi:hypothetical protein
MQACRFFERSPLFLDELRTNGVVEPELATIEARKPTDPCARARSEKNKRPKSRHWEFVAPVRRLAVNVS